MTAETMTALHATAALACPACAAAMSDRTSGLYMAGCPECRARQLAASPEAHAALNGGDPGKLREAIEAAWPGAYEVGRAAVWRWVKMAKAAV